MTTDNQLVLIDGHALAYRMYFALPIDSFSTKDGEPTNATYGFTRTLLDLLLAAEPPKYLAVTFDAGMTFRDDIFADYKGTREKMPDELDVQINRIKEVVKALNIPILEVEGYEADDVLGTIAKQVSKQQTPVYIITGDRDLLQLVDENTRVALPPRGNQPAEVFDVAGVVAYFGVRPEQVVDWKALVGDSSDNIPGVRGIGAKTATKLLQEYGSLEGIYAHIGEIKGALRKKLEEGKEEAFLSYKLARILTDVPIELDLEACVAQDFDAAEVLALFHELEFRTLTRVLLDNIENAAEVADSLSEQPATEVIIVRTEAQLEELVEQLNSAQVISFDVETTSINEMEAELVGICLAVKPPIGYYIPVGHTAGETQAESGQMGLFAGERRLAEGQLPLPTVLEAIRPAMTNPRIGKVAHNAKYDYTVLARAGLRVTPLVFDTMIAEWLTDPGSKHKGLKDLVRHRLGVEMTDITDLIGSGRGQKTFAEVPIEEAAQYGAADADMTLRLVPSLKAEIKEKNQEKVLELEMPLIPVLSEMEQAGVAIDREFFRQMSEELSARLRELETEIFEIAGMSFNVNSTQQLSDVLFKKLDLPREGLKKTSSGYYSTAAHVLEDLKAVDTTGIIRALLEYRELGKLKSTYVDALPQMINPRTGRIHTSLNQTGAITGRIASSSPNLQNIPIRSKLGQQIRRGFVSEPGWLFLSADYSQVELRILAHITQDEALLEAFRRDQDIHRATAAAVFHVDPEEIGPNQRRLAKNVNFGIIYGMGAFRLARESDLTLAEAENYIKEYFARFPGIQRYLDETKKKARKDGYVETLLGRRRYFPIFKAQASNANYQVQLRAEREAINHPIQGTAADIVKLAMIRLHEALAGYRARMLLQVHDELLIEAPEEEVAEIRPIVVDVMCNAVELDVPLKVDVSTGQNWLELKA